MSLLNILSTNKIGLDLTLYSSCSKNLSVPFIFDILCPLVSLFHQSRKLCTIFVSSHLIFFTHFGYSLWGHGGREEGIVWGFLKVSAPVKFLQLFPRTRKFLFVVMRSYEEKLSV